MLFALSRSALKSFDSILLLPISSSLSDQSLHFGPFNAHVPRRWKRAVSSAQTRMDNRTLDSPLDKLMKQHRRLKIVLALHRLMNADHMFVEMLAQRRRAVGLNTDIGTFLRKLPHVFEVYRHPERNAPCCRVTRRMRELIEEESKVVEESQRASVEKLKKLLMMSSNGTLHVHTIWLIRRELGLPDDFRDTVIGRHPSEFAMVNPEVVSLVSRDESLAEAAVEKWREREYREKWLSRLDTGYAFPIQFPTGFKIEKGFRERLKSWQRIHYLKPYDRTEIIRCRTDVGVVRFEKRVVAVIHEMLSLTVEKMLPVERLSHFRRDFRMVVNLREFLLKHPGIFYISTRDGTLVVLLREAYSKGRLVEPNPIYAVRQKMLELVVLGCRNTRGLQAPLQICTGGSNLAESG